MRQLPHAGKQSLSRSLTHKHFACMLTLTFNNDSSSIFYSSLFRFSLNRQLQLSSLQPSLTVVHHWADKTIGIVGRAHECTKLHERLVKISCLSLWNHRCNKLF